jgi:hypothetical protein
MFQSNNHHQGAYCVYFAKVIIIKLISSTLAKYKQSAP